MKGAWRDIRDALREIAGSSNLRGVVLVALAIGIGGALAIFRPGSENLARQGLIGATASDSNLRADRIAVLDLSLPPAQAPVDMARRVLFLNELFTRLRELPGIVGVGGSSCVPLPDRNQNGLLAQSNAVEALPETQKELARLFHAQTSSGNAEYCAATAGYFKALGIPLLRGRFFDARDTRNAPHVALISESLARLKWPGQDPLGKQLEFGSLDGDSRLLTIVGVVGDVRQGASGTPLGPAIYANYAQRPQNTQAFTVVMRTSGEVASLFPAAFHTRRDSADTLRYE